MIWAVQAPARCSENILQVKLPVGISETQHVRLAYKTGWMRRSVQIQTELYGNVQVFHLHRRVHRHVFGKTETRCCACMCLRG